MITVRILSLLAALLTTDPSPMPAGDAYSDASQVQPPSDVPPPQSSVEPSAAPVEQGVPDVPHHEAGVVSMVLIACIDTNGDRRCGKGEGIEKLPVYVLDADTNEQRAEGETDERGTVQLDFTLAKRARLSVNVPYLGITQLASPTERGVDVLLDAHALPEVLP